MSEVTGLPEITDNERQFLHYNPNTDDIVDWVRGYAEKATATLRQQLEEAQESLRGAEAAYKLTQASWEKLLADETERADKAEQRLANAETTAWQYYYSRNECKSESSNDVDCICWHNEGTGPYQSSLHDEPDSSLRWRQVQPATDELREIAELHCPEAYGFEGPETFPDCGKCVVCRSRAALAASKGEKP